MFARPDPRTRSGVERDGLSAATCRARILRGMPSPVGHALAGVAVGFLIGGGGRSRFSSRARDRLLSRNLLTDRRLIGFALMGMLADIDFLVGTHSTHTHSLGAILVVTAAVGCWGRGGGRGPLLALALGAAYGSHVLFDWLGSDSTSPRLASWRSDRSVVTLFFRTVDGSSLCAASTGS